MSSNLSREEQEKIIESVLTSDYRDNAFPTGDFGRLPYCSDIESDLDPNWVYRKGGFFKLVYHANLGARLKAYAEWLSDHLKQLDLKPIDSQRVLCELLEPLNPYSGIGYIIDYLVYDYHTIHDTEEIERFGRTQFAHVGYIPLDAGFRVPLAYILRKIDDDEERLELLRVFFMGYVEEINK